MYVSVCVHVSLNMYVVCGYAHVPASAEARGQCRRSSSVVLCHRILMNGSLNELEPYHSARVAGQGAF